MFAISLSAHALYNNNRDVRQDMIVQQMIAHTKGGTLILRQSHVLNVSKGCEIEREGENEISSWLRPTR